jgi:hypothetical protein
MRHGRFITTAVAALAAMAIGPAYAAAAPSPLTDDAITDFAAGTAGTDTWAVEPGVVRLKPAGVAENFDGAVLPAALAATPWPEGSTGPQTGGQASVAGGTLTVDGAHVNDANAQPTFGAPQTLEFRATFGADEYQNVGLGNTFNESPWALFGTGPASVPGTFFARTTPTGGPPIDTAIPVATVDPTQPHLYRIEWTATDVKFYVDNMLIPTPAGAITDPMRPVVSDLNVGGSSVKVDWLAMGSVPSTGAFVSHVLAADDARTVWGALTAVGSGATFETRSGRTSTPDATWSDWQQVGSGGAIDSPDGRQYIQYRATLTSAAASLDKVAIGYDIDTAKPSAAVSSVDVSATSASVSFSSPDTDTAGFECSLDTGAFAPCTSPKELTGLAPGSHAFAVRAIDKAGNVGDAATKSFTIASPSQSGGATPQPSGGNSLVAAVDKTAPKVSLVAKSLRVSNKGKVSFRVGCPATEKSCKVTLRLKNGGKSAASKTLSIKGGKTVTVTLTLNKATRQLLEHGTLKVSAVVTATDAAGNHKTTTKRMTLRRAAA